MNKQSQELMGLQVLDRAAKPEDCCQREIPEAVQVVMVRRNLKPVLTHSELMELKGEYVTFYDFAFRPATEKNTA